MPRRTLPLVAISVAGLGVLGLFGATLMPDKKTPESTTIRRDETPLAEPRVDFADPVRGNASAPVTVVVFGDFYCEPCAQVELPLQQLLLDRSESVRVVWKDLPNEKYRPGSTQAAVAARCAGDQGAFWQYHDLLLARQGSVGPDSLVPLAAELRLDVDQFQSCLAGEITKPLVIRAAEEAVRLGVDAVPYFFIGNRRVSGALTYEQLLGFVETATAQAQAQAAAPPTEPATIP